MDQPKAKTDNNTVQTINLAQPGQVNINNTFNQMAIIGEAE